MSFLFRSICDAYSPANSIEKLWTLREVCVDEHSTILMFEGLVLIFTVKLSREDPAALGLQL